MEINTTILTKEGKDPVPVKYTLDDNDLWGSLAEVLYDHATKELDIVNSLNGSSDNSVLIDFTWFSKVLDNLIYANNKKIRLGAQIICKPTPENVSLREQGVLVDIMDELNFITIFNGLLFTEYLNKLCEEEFGDFLVDLDSSFGFSDDWGGLCEGEISLDLLKKLINMFCNNMKIVFGNNIPLIIFPALNNDKVWYEYY